MSSLDKQLQKYCAITSASNLRFSILILAEGSVDTALKKELLFHVATSVRVFLPRGLLGFLAAVIPTFLRPSLLPL